MNSKKKKQFKKTKIVCTIGPATLQKTKIKAMYKKGMNCVRINTAYGDLNQYSKIVSYVRSLTEIPIILDIKGPEIRLKSKYSFIVKKGEKRVVGFGQNLNFNHNIFRELQVKDKIYIDNGKIETRIIKKETENITLLFLNNGRISDGKGVNIPNKNLQVQTLSKYDLECLKFATENDIEFLGLSYTRHPKDIENIRAKMNGFKGEVIAKIENSQGVNNFEQILKKVEFVMIARGDLGVEIQPENVPLIQKSLIKECNQQGKTVITATEMLESMIYQPIPTRAEVSDVANAILDGTDAVMLSGETSIGKYPVESVSMMSRIAKRIESSTKHHIKEGNFRNISDTISKSINSICQNMDIQKIVTLTRSGYTAKMISRFKLPQIILAVTTQNRVKKQLALVYGVIPIVLDYSLNKNKIHQTAKSLYSLGLINTQDTILFTAAARTTAKHASNLIEIHEMDEFLDEK